MGEGAYIAPELGNVVVRYGDEGVKAFIQARPKEGILVAAACRSSTSPTSNWTPSWPS